MKRKKNKICLLQLILSLICLFSMGTLFYDMVLVPKKNQEQAEELKGEFLKKDSSFTSAQMEENDIVEVIDFAILQEQYPDIQGWLTIPDTNIDYPVLQSGRENGEYYLRRNYRGERDINGSLFLQYDCDVMIGRNLIIYGHNMNSGAMFGNLEWLADADYWENHKSIFFQTVQGVREYEIVSVMKVDINMFPFQKTYFRDENDLMAYVNQAKERGLFETGEIRDVPPHILTLVTCSYEWNGARNVIVAIEK